MINHNSVFGIEALIKQKDVIIYSPDYITFPLGIGAELHSKGGCTLIKNTSEMIKHFNYIKVNNTPKNSKAEEYIQSYIYAFGETASKNIYNEITKRISQ